MPPLTKRARSHWFHFEGQGRNPWSFLPCAPAWGGSLVAIDDGGAVTLRQIELGNGQVSLPVAANIEFN